MKNLKKIVIIIICLIIICGVGFLFLGFTTENVGSNHLGSVEKITYSYYGDAPVTIVIISGMHSREKLHQSVLPDVAKSFALLHNCKVINYKIHVNSKPNDFNIGRANGESLVHDFVVKDLKKEGGADLVIIGHDHEPGYGEDYYIATPTMDNGSVNLAKKVTSMIGFKYYQRNTTQATKSSSINTVDYPLLKTHSKVFVYEIPEVDSESSAITKSYELVRASYDVLS